MSQKKSSDDSLGVLLSKTFREYKTHFRDLTLLLLLFLIIPTLVTTAAQMTWFFSSSEIQTLMLSPDFEGIEISYLSWLYVLVTLVIALIALVLQYYLLAGLISSSLQKKDKDKYDLKKVSKLASENFWRYIWLTILIMLVFFAIATIIGLLVTFLTIIFALVIPAEIAVALGFIIFFTILGIALFTLLIYWILSVYYLLDEKCSATDSMKKSYRVVKGRWWLTLGYLLVVGLIIMGFSSVINLPFFLFEMIYIIGQGHAALASTIQSPELYVFQTINELVISIFYAFVYPFSLIFFKNLYFAYKKNK